MILSPAAAGGGGAECMGYFNGINYPDVFSVETFIVKFFGLTFSVASVLCIGKEGVIAHMGSCIGIILFYFPGLTFMKYFRNNIDKRVMAASGQGAGVAAAFGSPIGGTLYAYEMTAPAVFWTFEMSWQIFFASCLATFSLSICDQLKDSNFTTDVVNTGGIKDGTLDPDPYTISDLPVFMLMGVFGGLLGAFFVAVHYNLGKFRKVYVNTKTKKVIEAMLYVAVTCTIIFFSPIFL